MSHSPQESPPHNLHTTENHPIPNVVHLPQVDEHEVAYLDPHYPQRVSPSVGYPQPPVVSPVVAYPDPHYPQAPVTSPVVAYPDPYYPQVSTLPTNNLAEPTEPPVQAPVPSYVAANPPQGYLPATAGSSYVEPTKPSSCCGCIVL
ncbi:hypothetical protein ERO13_A10G209300v2 [Gossypium hirsutum]|uniref:Uncharacterized protein n=4 Tax=Gossypium TaxID=3633 RepID=A0A5J5UAI4_GOSBA|nr:hypothetical protein ES319_A10G226500v1 [Gossypium barbadense]KAG4109253.1 hypothetical protein ERO13_1Z049507v2 [Gossypium hirsutum]TYH00191.1 hypothetical protein ES288_A10G254400v1 [Gossypium darwinii]TYI07812.1 hypothetical protein ES332_A10G250800v1 [Gossypium tomentosum]TYJ41300.1 hypothetical protein E1A91_A03G011100v1 [Gossypium mustelinum]